MSALNLTFREANDRDIPEIVNIHNSNVRMNLTSLDRGFLIAEVNEQSVRDNLSRGTQYWVAARANDILGFVAISQPKISTEMLKQIDWNEESYQDKVRDPRHIFIQVLATQTEWSGRGVAQFMYRSLYDTFPNSFFSLFVVINPIVNQRSMNFHLKQGFKQIGTIRWEEFLDLKNYEDALMFKDNSKNDS
ncbi:MAG: N-acetyltransferase [Cyanobacteria bacterium J055]|nr:MAG: N-acetyltransferase [Cyanobacteria bacterium J055]